MTEPPLGPMCSDETIFSKFVASVTFLTKPVSAKWMSQTRNGVLPKIAKDLIQAMEGYAGRLNKIQFMNCLLAEQESYGRVRVLYLMALGFHGIVLINMVLFFLLIRVDTDLLNRLNSSCSLFAFTRLYVQCFRME